MIDLFRVSSGNYIIRKNKLYEYIIICPVVSRNLDDVVNIHSSSSPGWKYQQIFSRIKHATKSWSRSCIVPHLMFGDRFILHVLLCFACVLQAKGLNPLEASKAVAEVIVYRKFCRPSPVFSACWNDGKTCSWKSKFLQIPIWEIQVSEFLCTNYNDVTDKWSRTLIFRKYVWTSYWQNRSQSWSYFL